ncbi:MAG: SRPBCC domain-containing protein [Candidatus Limnocylindrales bacterium]
MTFVSPTADAIEVQKRIRARPETVFAFLTQPDLYRQWKGREAELDARPGGIYRVVMPGGIALGEYHLVDSPRRVVFSWGWEGDPNVPPGSSLVEITLVPDGAETVLHLRHSGLPAAAVAQHDQGWGNYLARLAVVATGDDPGPDPFENGTGAPA